MSYVEEIEGVSVLIDRSFQEHPYESYTELAFVRAFSTQILGFFIQKMRELDASHISHPLDAVLTKVMQVDLSKMENINESARIIACYFYMLSASLSHLPSDNSVEILSGASLEKIFRFAKFGFDSKFPYIIFSSFTAFLGAVGSRSSLIYQEWEKNLKDKVKQKDSIREYIKLVGYLAGNLSSLKRVLHVLESQYRELERYRREQCEALSSAVMNAMRTSPENFMRADIELTESVKVTNRFTEKKRPNRLNPIKYGALAAVSFLQQPGLRPPCNRFDDYYNYFSSELDKIKVIKNDEQLYKLEACLFFASATQYTSGMATYADKLEKFINKLTEIAKLPPNEKMDPYSEYLYLDLPAALFATRPAQYNEFLGIFQDPQFHSKVPLVIDSLTRSLSIYKYQKNVLVTLDPESDNDNIKAYHNRLKELLERMSSVIYNSFNILADVVSKTSADNKKLSLYSFSNLFANHPDFFFLLLGSNELVTRLSQDYATLQASLFCHILISIIDVNNIQPVYMHVFSITLRVFLSNAEVLLYQPPYDLMMFHEYLRHILTVLGAMEEAPPNKDEILYLIECLSLITLASRVADESIKTIRQLCLQLGEDTDSYSAFSVLLHHLDSTPFHVNENTSEILATRLINERTPATDALFSHILSMTSFIAPALASESTRSIPPHIQNPVEYVKQSFGPHFMLYISLLRSYPEQLSRFIESVISSNDTQLLATIQTLPDKASSQTMLGVVKIICEKSKAIDYADKNNKSLIENSMKLLNRVLRRDTYELEFITHEQASVLATSYTEFCHKMVFANLLAVCAEFLDALFSRYAPLINLRIKLDIAGIISLWLMRSDIAPMSPEAGSRFCNALASILSGIEFTSANADDLRVIIYALEWRVSKVPANLDHVIKVFVSLAKSNHDLFLGKHLSRMIFDNSRFRACYTAACNTALVEAKTVSMGHSSSGGSVIDLIFDENFEILSVIMLALGLEDSNEFSGLLSKSAFVRHQELELQKFLLMKELETEKVKRYFECGIPYQTLASFMNLYCSEWSDRLVDRISTIVGSYEGLASIRDQDNKLEHQGIFANLMYEILDVFTSSLLNLPISAIKLLQIVGNVIEEGDPEASKSLLMSLLYRDLCIYKISSYGNLAKNVDIKPIFVEIERVLEISAESGRSSELGNDFSFLASFCKFAQHSLSATLDDLLSIDLKDSVTFPISVDRKALESKLQNFLRKRKDVIEKVLKSEEAQAISERFNEFLQILIVQPTMEPEEAPENIEKNIASLGKKDRERFGRYSKLNISQKDRDKLENAIFIHTPIGSKIYYLYFVGSRLPDVTYKAIFYHFISLILKIPRDFIIIADLSGIKNFKNFTAKFIEKFVGLVPEENRKRFRGIRIIRVGRSFGEHVIHLMQSHPTISGLGEITNIVKFISDKSECDLLPERLSERLSVHCSLLDQDGVEHQCRTDKYDITVRVKKTGIHIIHLLDNQGFVKSLNFFMFREISGVQQSETSSENSSFKLLIKKGNTLELFHKADSSLFEVIKAARERHYAEERNTPEIISDTMTVHWALFILALFNLKCQDDEVLRRETLVVLETLASEFGIKARLPSDLSSTIEDDEIIEIMSSVAESHPSEAPLFVHEFINIVKVVEDDLIYRFIVPWVKGIANGLGGVSTVRSLLLLNSENYQIQKVLRKEVWNVLAGVASDAILDALFDFGDDERYPILEMISEVNKEKTSEFTIARVKRRYHTALDYAEKLVANGKFDIKKYGADLVLTCFDIRDSSPFFTARNTRLARLVLGASASELDGLTPESLARFEEKFQLANIEDLTTSFVEVLNESPNFKKLVRQSIGSYSGELFDRISEKLDET